MPEFIKNITDNINIDFDEIFGMLVKGGKILIYFLIGWFLVWIVSKIIEKALGATKIDDKFAGWLGKSSDGIEKVVGRIIFWIGMLFVIIITLNNSGIETDVLAPITGMLNKFLGIIPNLFGAVLIAVAAWIIATIAKVIISNSLSALKVDERVGAIGIGEKLGMEDDGIDQPRPITSSVSMIIYFFIILVFLPSIFQVLGISALTDTVKGLTDSIVEYIPSVLAATLIIAVGYLIANIVKNILANALPLVGFDSIPEKIGYKVDSADGKSPSQIVGLVVMVSFMVVIVSEALRVLNLPVFSDITKHLVPGYFKLLGAIIIAMIGIWAANIVHGILAPRNALWARIAKIIILFFVAAIALQKANISTISNEVFQSLINYGIVAAAVALGIGGAIAIGLGGRESVARYLNKRVD